MSPWVFGGLICALICPYDHPGPLVRFARGLNARTGCRYHEKLMSVDSIKVEAVVRDLGKTKSAKQKAAKEARKIVELKGNQIKDELSLAMIQLFIKLLDEDSVEASTIDDAIRGSD